MLRSEFETMTGIYPSSELYEIIEKHYNASDVQKDTFCDAYKRNVNGLAEEIQKEADDKAYRQRADYEDRISQKNAEIELLEKQYSKQFMVKSELIKIGLSLQYLNRAIATPGQTFAFKLDPSKKTSPYIFDMQKFEQWRIRDASNQNDAKKKRATIA